jgi:hypothetical protein
MKSTSHSALRTFTANGERPARVLSIERRRLNWNSRLGDEACANRTRLTVWQAQEDDAAGVVVAARISVPICKFFTVLHAGA